MMKRSLLLLVASLVIGASALPVTSSARAASGTRGSQATAIIKADPNTDPVAPVNPDGSGSAFPGDSQDSNNTGTGSRGHLTLDYISNLKFQQQATSPSGFITATATNSKAFVQITDRRGTGTGWSLLLKPEPLVGQSDYSVLKQATLSLGYSYFTPSVNSGQVNYPQVVNDGALPVGSYSLVARAQDVANHPQGVGTWLLRLNTKSTEPTSLSVLASAVKQSQVYQGKLSWLLTDAPQ